MERMKKSCFAIFGIAALGCSSSTSATEMEYCTQQAPPGNTTQVCFNTFDEAENHLLTESVPPAGFRFLKRDSVKPRNPSLGTYVWSYTVQIQPVDQFIEDYFHGSLTLTNSPDSWCSTQHAVYGFSETGCSTEEEQVAYMLADYPYNNNYPGFVSGSYPLKPIWLTLPMNPTTGVAATRATFRAESVDPSGRALTIQLPGGDRFNSIWRLELHTCPAGLYAIPDNPGIPDPDWPYVCHRSLPSTIVGRPKKFTVCSVEGPNPCKPATGAKEYDESDFYFGGIRFNRHYNSLNDVPLNSGFPGDNWSHSFSAQVLVGPTNSDYVTRVDEKGYLHPFRKVATNKFISTENNLDFLVRAGSSTWTFYRSGSVESYDAAGKLLSMQDGGGRVTTIDYCTSSEDISGTCAAVGLIESVSDSSGRTIDFVYNATAVEDRHGRTMAAPTLREIKARDGAVLVAYEYDGYGRLTSAERSPSDITSYVYGEAGSVCQPSQSGVVSCDPVDFRYHLTQVTTADGSVRAYTYDGAGKALSTSLGLPENSTVLDYPSATTAIALRPSGATVSYTFQATAPFRPLSQVVTDTASAVTQSTSWTYDANGRRLTTVDPNGSITKYFYPSETVSRTENWSAGSAAKLRMSTDTRDAASNRVIERLIEDAAGVDVAKSNWTYNARGQVLTRMATDPSTLATRTTTYAYCESANVALPASTCPLLGLLKSIDGPRTDVSDITTYTYYPATDESGCATTGPCHRKGDLWTVTNALGHVTETLRYDRAGRVRASADPRGVVTEFTYHPRGWLTSRTVKGATTPEDATTTYTYDAVGQVTRITQPDGDWLDYAYDAAHRLVAIEDAAGNRIDYTLDAAGNRTAETTSDGAAVVKRQLTRVYDQLGRLDQQLDAQSRITDFAYDANGNQTGIEDALNVETKQDYDPLNRLKKTIQDYTGLDVETNYAYDALDRLVTVTDPKGLDTDYTYDGLGNLTQLTSPDTGITSYTYDAAGNRLTQTDARGITATHTYDALNRLTSTAYPTTSLNLTYQYDQPNGTTGCATSFPTGRLTRTLDASGTTTYCYDRRGNLTKKAWSSGANILVTDYGYTAGDRLASTTLPTGLTLTYTRNSLGQLTAVTRTDSTPDEAIVTAADYLPFGPLQALTFAGGTTQTYSHDQNYWTDGVSGTALSLDFTLDATGNITAANDPTPASARLYTYDPLARLTDIDTGSNTLVEAFTYDATGNRLSKQTGGGTQTYGYPPSSHRLTSIDAQPRVYDAMGSLTTRGTDTFTYDDRQRLVVYGATATYGYNAKGERASKTVAGTTTHYVYDEAGHLIAELDPATIPPTALRSYVWLDDRPVALYAHTGAYANQWLHIHTDHLGTPRAITQPAASNATIWRWDFNGSAFGDHVPQTDPDGDAIHIVFNLRFPGQYFDVESGLHYNYFRNYEAVSGRYIESDPIGLRAGPASYPYVGGDPLGFSDFLGLKKICKWEDRPLIDWVWGRGNMQVGSYRDVTCVDVPDPPRLPSPDPCENGKCDSCTAKCWDRHSFPWPWDAVGPAFAAGGLISEYVGAGAASTAGTAAGFSIGSACALVGAGITGYEVGTAGRCILVCALDQTSY